MYEYRMTVTKVTDGDTVHVHWELGHDVAIEDILRFYGINAPELSTAAGVTAKQYVVDWLAQHAPDNRVYVKTIKDKKEKYGRYLAVIYNLETDGETQGSECLNDDLISSGNAVVYLP